MQYADSMRRVGIGELRRNLSVYIAKVKEGEAFSVTDRGEPVAVLKPKLSQEEAWQRLIDEGRVTPAKTPFRDFLRDYKPPQGEVDHDCTASRYLQEMREDRI